MPTDRFFRISEEKRESILSAAMEEFARTSFEKASINQIIRGAGISRGSFYTYFDGKEDLLSFLMKDYCEKLKHLCCGELERNQGSYVSLLLFLYDHLERQFQETRSMLHVFRNTLVSREELVWGDLFDWMNWAPFARGEPPFGWLFDRVRLEGSGMEDEKRRYAVFLLGMSALSSAFKQRIQNPGQHRWIREMLCHELQILQDAAETSIEIPLPPQRTGQAAAI